jgi:hypothetical protein
VQPGSPYPVFAQVDRPDPYPYPRIQVWRCTPAGSQQISSACGTTSVLPTIGIRRVSTPTGEDSRLVLGYGLPSALAVCCVAPAGATAWQGSALPLSLDPIGFAGCSLRVPPDASAFRIVGSAGMDTGYAAVDLRPAMVATGGSAYAAQWLLFDPLTLGYGATARQQFRVQ